MLHRLTDPRLTGMSVADLQQLVVALAAAQAARAQQRYCEQRGGRARRATGNLRGKPIFDDAARLLLTLLYQRQVCSMNVAERRKPDGANGTELAGRCCGATVRCEDG
jgi:hypothetical protein